VCLILMSMKTKLFIQVVDSRLASRQSERNSMPRIPLVVGEPGVCQTCTEVLFRHDDDVNAAGAHMG